MSSRIALFGGAFDPPHIGHQQIAEYLLQSGKSDQVWFVPVKHHPFGKTVAANGHRVSMLELVLQPEMRIETFELDRPDETSYTATTLQALSEQHPESTLSWVIGSDNLRSFDKWGGAIQQSVLDHVFWVYPRAGFDSTTLLLDLEDRGWLPAGHQIKLLLDAPEVTASSTLIKERLVANYSAAAISDLVDPVIASYIIGHELYTPASQSSPNN